MVRLQQARAADYRRPQVVEGFHNGDHSDDPALRHKSRSEKETDVNIAIALVLDAAKQAYDRTILLTGDYDQLPSVRAVSQEFMKGVKVWLPPRQNKGRWKEFDGDTRVSVHMITPELLQRAKLPDVIAHPKGKIESPVLWRAKS
jgi:hypothetical protein